MQPSQLLSRTRLRLISSMFAQMCDAVAACHLQQVYHRDIKPENFIVTDGWITTTDGRQERKVIVKLTDFGLSTTDVESSDMDCGSAPYMSYECRNNIAPTYRPRAADVWSLGIVLINMLYHYNPWTDTAQGACNSFDLFRQHPVNFFMQRFAGMTRPVAELFASRVFNVINESSDDSRRITASEFGSWAKDLPDLLGDQPSPSFTHKRVLSVSSTHGYPIALSTPASHRPSSRQASNSATAMRSQSRSASRAPSIGPSFQRPDLSELSTVIDQGDLEEQDEPEENDAQDVYVEGMTSRSTSTNKRRKRGARKGKGGLASPTHQDETLATLAVASQSLAREISKASKVSSHHSVRSISTKASTTESARARRQLPYEPVSMYPIPTALYSRSSSHSAATSPAPTLASQPSFASIPSFSAPVPVAATAAPVVTKKPSKWKLSFSKATSTALVSPSEELSSPPLPEITPSQQQHAMSATASNVTSLIMGLSAPTVHSAPVTMPPLPPIPDDAASTWTRGRRSRGPSPHGGKSRSRGPPSQHAPSPSPHPSADRWPVEADRRSDRAVSPNSTRSGRPVASCGSSMVSGNWRSSTSTTSSAGTSTSAFTHYSNSSLRSVSTAATSVSATSWRTNGSKPPLSSPKHAAYPHIPKNVKIMDGVPWELMELPRQQHPNPVGDIFGQPPVRKQRTRKPKELTLDTITERPQNSAAKGSPGTRQRRDASTSTTDLRGVLSHESTKDDGDNSPKKVQKGQINALAKMLSALRR